MKIMGQRNAAEEETYVSSDHYWLAKANHIGWDHHDGDHRFLGSKILLCSKRKGRNANILGISSMTTIGKDMCTEDMLTRLIRKISLKR